MKRGRRVFLASALLLVAILGAAALVFREEIREQWLIWRLEHGSLEEGYPAALELGAMGSLEAIEPLVRWFGVVGTGTGRTYLEETPYSSAALSALFEIAKIRGDRALPYLESARQAHAGAAWKGHLGKFLEVAAQIARGARNVSYRQFQHLPKTPPHARPPAASSPSGNTAAGSSSR